MNFLIESSKKHGGKGDFKFIDKIAEKLEKTCLLKPLAIANQVRLQPQAVKSCGSDNNEKLDNFNKISINYSHNKIIQNYLDDSIGAGHSTQKVNEIAEKLKNVKWSTVDKPDITKIKTQELKNRIIENYRDTSIYGNKSAADALRYEKVTGILLSNKGHIEKCEKEYRALRKNIENGFFSDNDKNIATKIMNDLTDALGYIPDKVNIPINKF